MTSTRTPLSASLSSSLAPSFTPNSFNPSPRFVAPDAQTGVQPVAPSLRQVTGWVDSLDRAIPLPNSLQSFSIFLVGLILLTAGAFLHVYLAVQVLEAKVQVEQLRKEIVALEQLNGETIFAIARETNLVRLQEQVVAHGYVPIQDRAYIVPPAKPIAQQPAPALEPLPVAAQALPAAQPNWRSWEAFLGLGDASVSPTTVSTRTSLTGSWSSWWGQLEDSGQRIWSDWTGR